MESRLYQVYIMYQYQIYIMYQVEYILSIMFICPPLCVSQPPPSAKKGLHPPAGCRRLLVRPPRLRGGDEGDPRGAVESRETTPVENRGGERDQTCFYQMLYMYNVKPSNTAHVSRDGIKYCTCIMWWYHSTAGYTASYPAQLQLARRVPDGWKLGRVVLR